MDSRLVQVIQKYANPMSWPSLTRPSTQRQRHLRGVSNLGNNIIALIAGFRVLVDGRVKPAMTKNPK
jgi:hypothetical protein